MTAALVGALLYVCLVELEVAPVIAGIKTRLAEVGRSIDEDHYGAGFGFRFGSADEPICQRYIELLTKRLGREPKGFLAAGNATDIMALVHEFRAAGVHKFILRPVASGAEDFIDQTRLFVEKLMPEIAALNS